jgi:hypothetical protein
MRRKITHETWEQVKTAFAAGVGLREIARNMSIPEGTVLAHAKREGWTNKIQSGERHVERMAGVSERGVDHIETMDGPEILNSVDQIEKLDKVARRTFGLKDDNPLMQSPVQLRAEAAVLHDPTLIFSRSFSTA